MVRMVIAEPDELLLLRMSGQFSRAEGLEVVGTARDCSSALDLVRSTRPDVVLVDLFLPPLGGVALIAAIKHAVPDTRVVALVADVRESTPAGRLRSGCGGFRLEGWFRSTRLARDRLERPGQGRRLPTAATCRWRPARAASGRRFTTAGV